MARAHRAHATDGTLSGRPARLLEVQIVITLKVPGLPEDGQIQWRDVAVAHVPHRRLSEYLADLGLDGPRVSHVIVDGHVIRRSHHVSVPVQESKLGRAWRILLRRPAPLVHLPAFDTVIPVDGAVMFVLPSIDGRNASLILGVIGGIAAIALSVPTGGLSIYAYFQAGFTTFLTGYAIGSTIGSLITPGVRPAKDANGPSSYVWGGIQNDDRAGIPKPIMLGERLVGGVRISAFRRRPFVVPERNSHHAGTEYDDAAPHNASEKLYLLLLLAGHETEGPVGISDPNAAIDFTTNKPDIRLNGQHYANFPGVEVEYRTGAAGQAVIEGFNAIANTYDFAVDLTALGTGVNYSYTTVRTDCDAFEVLLTCPGLSHTDSKGRLKTNDTIYVLEYRLVGSGTWINVDANASNQRTVSDQTRTTRFETRRVGGLTPGQYDIRVRWISSPNTDPTTDQWHIVLTGITEEKQFSTAYPGQSLIAIKGVATEQLSGAMPTVTSRWRGAKPQKWTGSAFAAASWGVGGATPAGRNPHWLALWVIRNKELGCGNDVADGDIDLASIKSAADYSDELETVTPVVSGVTGTPYTEPRFQFDAYIDQQQPAVDLIQGILSTARSALIFSGNKIRFCVDRPGTPVQLFNMGNVDFDTFEADYKSERPQVNAYDVSFDDSAADFETEPLTVCIKPDGTFADENDMTTAGFTVRRRSLGHLWGVTRRTQSVREGRFKLKQAFALRVAGSFRASTDAILAETFDLINVGHDVPQWGYSGRAFAGSTVNTIRIDRGATLPFVGGHTYQVMVRYAAGDGAGHELVETRTVSAIAGPDGSGHYGLTVSAPFSQTPQYGDLWSYGETGIVVKPFRILDISREQDDQRSLQVVEYNASLYNTDGPMVIPIYSALPSFSAPPPPITLAAVSVDSITQTADNSKVTAVLIQWTRPMAVGTTYGPYKGARIEYALSSTGPWTPIQSVDGVEFRWTNPPYGVNIWIRLTPYSTAGKYNYAGTYTIGAVNFASNWSRTLTPQNPTTVVLGSLATRRRTVQSQINPGDPLALLAAKDRFVTWAFTDAVNPSGTLAGFRVIVYDNVSGDPHHPFFDSGVISDPAARRAEVPNLSLEVAATYVAAVQSVYIDGYVSAFATSTGVLLDPNTYEPVVRGSDDRNALAYAESFDGAALPTGFYVFNATQAFANGEIQLTATSSSGCQLSWHFDEWAAAYLDSLRRGVGTYGFVRIAFDTAPAAGANLNVTVKTNPASGDSTKTIPLVPDTTFHSFRFPLGNIPAGSLAGVHVIFELSTALANGHTARITNCGIGFESIDTTFDGYMDRAINARNQFGRDAVGLGFFLQSPIRQVGDPAGNVIVIEKNGMFWLRSGGGMDIPVKRAIKAVLRGCFDKEFFTWGNPVGSAGGLLEPALPGPVASSKVRILVERAHDQPLDAAATFYPQRTQLEAVEITQSGFRIAAHKIEGPGYGIPEAPAGGGGNSNGWAGSAIKKSALTLASSASTVNNGDAWYDVYNDLFFGGGLTVGQFYYSRCVLWVAAQMPTSKKADGTYYYADLDFDVHYAKGVNGTGSNPNPFHFSGWGSAVYSASGYRMRVYTDGGIYRYPLVFTPMYGIWSPVMKVDWYGQTLESGGSAPTSVWLDRFEGSAVYVGIGTGQESGILNNDLNVTMVEEF
jgi:hypothetical protein